MIIRSGFEIRGCQEPRAPLNSPAAPSNFCREPKDVLFSIQNTYRYLSEMQLGSLEKILISSPTGKGFSFRDAICRGKSLAQYGRPL